jgi:hypothetical protein
LRIQEADLLLRPFPLGDVAGDGGEELDVAVRVLVGEDHHRDGNLAPVATEQRDFAGPHTLTGRGRQALLGRGFVARGREVVADGGLRDVLLVYPDHPLARGVDVEHPSARVRDADEVGRRVQDGHHAGLGLLGPLALGHLARQSLVRSAQVGLPFGDVPHLSDVLEARADEEDVLNNDPSGVFGPPPRAGDQHAEDRLWPVEAAHQVVEGNDRRGRDEYPPVAVEGQQRQRAEDVEVRLDPPVGEVDQQRPHQCLRDGDDVPRGRRARSGQGKSDGQRNDRPPE